MPTFSNNWFQRATPFWTAFFKQLQWTDGRPLTVVEVGSFEGQSTLWILDNLLGHPDSRIHCVDSFAGGVEHSSQQTDGLRQRFDANVAESANASKVRVLQGLSRDGLATLRHENVLADFVYIDGSHQAPDVLEDLILAFRVARVGAIIICDDYLWHMERRDRIDLLNAPKLGIDSFVNCYWRKLSVIQNQPLYQLAFQKTAD